MNQNAKNAIFIIINLNKKKQLSEKTFNFYFLKFLFVNCAINNVHSGP